MYVLIGIGIFIATAAAGFCFWKRRTIYIVIKTFPRDIRMILALASVNLYTWKAKRKNLTVYEQFDIIAGKNPDKVCFYFDDEVWTYKKVRETTNSIASYFSTHLKKGDTVALFMENCPDYICIWLGLSKLGVVTALINTNLKQRSLVHCIKVANTKSIIYGLELSQAVADIKQNEELYGISMYFYNRKGILVNDTQSLTKDDKDLWTALQNMEKKDFIVPKDYNGYFDSLFYIYTSGTTGLPKPVIFKHYRYFMAASGTKYVHKTKFNDIIYAPLPLYHTVANVLGVGNALLFGSSVVLKKKFSASMFWKDCIKYNVTVFLYVGEVCRYLVTQPPSLDDTKHKVRLMIGNGLRREIWNEFLTRFNIARIRELYGSSEGNCALVGFDNQVGAVGIIPRIVLHTRIYPLILIKVNEITNEPLRDAKTGLVIKCGFYEPGELIGIIDEGNPVKDFQGYANSKSREDKIVRNVKKHGDLAFRSGDILEMDEFGYLYFKDRQGDTFRWKGENVSTAEVEGIISRVAGFTDVAVYGVGIPGTEGKAGMAAITGTEGSIDLKKLASEFDTNLPEYAKPMFIRVMKSLDMTGTYKISKVELQKEGFDINKIQDKLYFRLNGEYVPLNTEIFYKIISGQIRL